MKFGRQNLKTVEPNAEQLLEATGTSPAEMHAMLGSFCLASTVAAAMGACLAEPIDRTTLANKIAELGVDKIRSQVRKLYANAANAPESEVADDQA